MLTHKLLPLGSILLLVLVGCNPRRSTSQVVKMIDVENSSVKQIREQTTINGVLAGAAQVSPETRTVVRTVQFPAHPAIPGSPVIPVMPQMPATPDMPQIPAIAVMPQVPSASASSKGVEIRIDGTAVSVSSPSKRAPEASPVVIRLQKIRSDKSHSTEQAALVDALNVARLELMKKMQHLDPPLIYSPSIVTMRNDFLKRQEKVLPTEDIKQEWQASELNPNRVWVEVDVEVSQSQLQQIRAGERVNTGLGLALLVFVIALAAHGFLRFDAWTKGYLTIWLGIGAIGLVLLAALVTFG